MSAWSAQALHEVGIEGAVSPEEHFIVILPAGRCHLSSFVSLPSAGRHLPRHVEENCSWKLHDSIKQRQELAIQVASAEYPSHRFNFDETPEGRLILWQYITDPDAWKYIEYVKGERPRRATVSS